MKVVLINKTDNLGHHGCTLVNCQIDVLAQEAGMEIVAKLPLRSNWDAEVPQHFDAVIVNGEGTLHSTSDGARAIMDVPKWAAKRGSPAHLINSVYQNNSNDLGARLAGFSTITVRDRKSAAETARHGVHCEVVPDLSLTWQPKPARGEGRVVVNGSTIEAVRRELFALSGEHRPYLPMTARPAAGKRRRAYGAKRLLALFRPPGLARARRRNAIDEFDEFVEFLSNKVSGIITGRFHMVTIALCLEIPVVAVVSNTHKIEALFEELNMLDRLADSPAESAEKLKPFSEEERDRIRSFRAETRDKSERLFLNIVRRDKRR
jgi:hypothetical protein